MRSTPHPAILSAALALLVSACWYRPARLADLAPVTVVDDAQPSEVPARREYNEAVYLSDVYLRRLVVDLLDPTRYPKAGDVNSMDEVPRSTWFMPNIGSVPLSLDGPPVPPLTVLPEPPKAGADGIVVSDSRGLRYELRRDPADRPEMTTSAAFIASRLVRAFGLLAPEVWILSMAPNDIAGWNPASDDPAGAVPRAFFLRGPPAVDGRFRVSATRWPVGIDVGIAPDLGVRSDDPNDEIPHQDRRSLRGLKVLGAWLDIRGLGVRKTRDCYVGARSRGHLWHFVVGLEDFLGASGVVRPGTNRGLRTDLAGSPGRSLVSLGLWPGKDPPLTQTRWPAIGDFSSSVDPGAFSTPLPYAPVHRAQDPDGYWAAKRIATIPSDLIYSAIHGARLSDPTARAQLTRVLLDRRTRVVRYWLSRVTPCEVQRTHRRVVVLRDLSVELGESQVSEVRYWVTALDQGGNELTIPREVRLASAEFAIEIPAPIAQEHRRVVLRLESERNGVLAPRATYVHLASDSDDSQRVIGVTH